MTPETAHRIRKLHAQGKIDRVIGKAVGLAACTIKAFRHRNGLPAVNRPKALVGPTKTEMKEAEIDALYKGQRYG